MPINVYLYNYTLIQHLGLNAKNIEISIALQINVISTIDSHCFSIAGYAKTYAHIQRF